MPLFSDVDMGMLTRTLQLLSNLGVDRHALSMSVESTSKFPKLRLSLTWPKIHPSHSLGISIAYYVAITTLLLASSCLE
jgi:hypothetical protein